MVKKSKSRLDLELDQTKTEIKCLSMEYLKNFNMKKIVWFFPAINTESVFDGNIKYKEGAETDVLPSCILKISRLFLFPSFLS